MKDKSEYMFTLNEVDKNHCLYIKPIGEWKKICQNDDEFEF